MNIKAVFFLYFSMTFGVSLSAQTYDIIYEVPSTPLKDQQSSGTCWSFASASFIETEAMRLGKEAVSISPIYYVAPTYLAKAENYINNKGESYFDAGDLTFSVMDAYHKYGAIPETIYDGIIQDDWQHDHLEMDNLLAAMVASIATSGYGRIKPHSWKTSVEGVLKSYLGNPPATFIYKDQLHTAQSFAKEYIGVQAEEYLEITSYTHGAFYEMMVLDIPANWNKNKYLNLPLNELETIINHALANGYSLAWDGDITEPKFDIDAGLLQLESAYESIEISQALRQSTFEDQSTTDDHNMHIIGMVRDSDNKIYYLLKNSEGPNKMDGYVYMTRNALLLKTISLLVHIEGIPAKIRDNCKFE